MGVLTAALMGLAFAAGQDAVWFLGLTFACAGLYVAVQEALESAVTAEMVPQDRLASSYGALGLVNGGAKLISSSAVGLLWTLASPVLAFALAAALMAAGTVALTFSASVSRAGPRQSLPPRRSDR